MCTEGTPETVSENPSLLLSRSFTGSRSKGDCRPHSAHVLVLQTLLLPPQTCAPSDVPGGGCQGAGPPWHSHRTHR